MHTLNKKSLKRTIMATSLIALGSVFSATAIADAGDMDSVNNIIVDENTPDDILLRDKNLTEMNKVISPSVKLSMAIEGINKAVQVEGTDPNIMLIVESPSSEEAQEILRTYKMINENSEAAVIDAE